jgi:hypothetical protein
MHNFQSILPVAGGMRYPIVQVSCEYGLRWVKNMNKQRAVSILLLFGGILVVMATWKVPVNRLTEEK